MIVMAVQDLGTLAARLVEVFELAEFTEHDATGIAETDDLARLVAADWICEQGALFGEEVVYTNKILSDSAA